MSRNPTAASPARSSATATLPKAGAQLVFVPDASSGKSVDAKADKDGKFQASLADGGYLVYVRDGDGRAVYHSTVQVKSSDNRETRLVSR